MATKRTKTKSIEDMDSHELMHYHADRVVAMRQQIKELQEQLEVSENYLKVTFWEQGFKSGTIVGNVQLTERALPPKLIGATGKALEHKQAQLVALLPNFVNPKLDISKIAACYNTDAALRQHLLEVGLSVSKETAVSIKVLS